MKKQIKWLVAALALTALATPAMAVTADLTGSLSVRAFNTSDFTAGNGDRQRFVDQRLRLFTTAAANENVKAVLGLEVDNIWGREKDAAATSDKEIGALGSDAKGQLEVKHLYLDFTLPGSKANVKAGTQAFNLGRGLIINDDAAGLQAAIPCPLVEGNTLSLYWIKPYEKAVNNKQDESDFYGLKYALKAGDLTVAPYAGALLAGAASPYGEATAYWLGADVDGKAGDLGYGLTAIFNSWEIENGPDGGSVALLAKADYTMGDTKLMAEVARYGDKDAGGEFVTLQDPNANSAATGPINNFSEILTGGLYTSNSTGKVNVNGAANLYTANYLYAKLGAKQKLSDDMSVSGYVMHIEQAEDTAVDAITYGQEVDLYFDYAINKALGLNVAVAYLLADKDFNNDENLSKYAASLNYKF